jgi:hypothetical protein
MWVGGVLRDFYQPAALEVACCNTAKGVHLGLRFLYGVCRDAFLFQCCQPTLVDDVCIA